MSAEDAPEQPLPFIPFYTIEYPGYVSPASVPQAIQSLGGQANLEHSFKHSTSKEDSLLELHLRPGNPFSHPVAGNVLPTNSILLKVVKRKRKRRDASDEPIGEYTTQALGLVTKTTRFRSIADFQFMPDMDDPIAKLRVGMEKMDVETILNFKIPPEKGEYTVPADTNGDKDFPVNLDPQLLTSSEDVSQRSNLRLFPPPIFNRQNMPLTYNFKSNPTSMVSSTIDEETGEERKRLINRMRWKGYGPATISFLDTIVPDKPPSNVEETRNQADKQILSRLHQIFAERPVWTRAALLNQFTPAESREILNSKILLPLVCYVFQDGPWRDTLVRFSYDPRKDISARFYQRLYLRNVNHPISRPSVMTRRQDRAAAAAELAPKEGDQRTSHIFDGKTLARETAAFQLCDIEDPMLKEMINTTEELREACSERDGWYTSYALDRIKTVLRRKFFSLLDGNPISDEECRSLLIDSENHAKANRNARLRPGKHNMAKGALRPEDAAALRLRATLDRNAKRPS